METRTDEPTFKGEFLPPPPLASQSANRLSDQALLALPFIGMFVGVDELVPTKAIYAIYDFSNCGISYVRGDGTFAISRQICFTRQFKDASIPLHRSQRTYTPELMARSAMHYHRTNTRDVYPANIRVQYPTPSSIKTSLTYLCDLKIGTCPALIAFDSTPRGPDQAPPHMSLVDNPIWDFNPAGFQAFAAPGNDIIDTKYMEYKQKYPSVRINVVDFQHAVFCLAGMLKAGLINFLWEGQNDRKWFIRGLTPVKPEMLVRPLRTAKGWTVDCLIARFESFQDVYTKVKYAQIPNPINWLEAQMDYEAQFERIRKPWKIETNEEDDSIISWELLKVMQFNTRGDSKEYPKSLIPKAPRPLVVKDFISKNGKLRESKYVKKDRMEREKANKKALRHKNHTMDLPGSDTNGFVTGHMGQDPDTDRYGRTKCHSNHVPRVETYAPTTESRVDTPDVTCKKRKRNTGLDSLQNRTVIIDDDDDPGNAYVKPVKQEPKLKHYDIESEELYIDSGSETRQNNKSHRGRSPIPVPFSLFASPGRTLREQEELAIRLSSAADSQQDTPRSLCSENFGLRDFQRGQNISLGNDSEEEIEMLHKKKKRVSNSEGPGTYNFKLCQAGKTTVTLDKDWGGHERRWRYTSSLKSGSTNFIRESDTQRFANRLSTIDLDPHTDTTSSPSTVKSDSSAENLPLDNSRTSTSSTETPSLSSRQTSYRPSSRPRTPSPQTGERFYGHIAAQNSRDVSPLIITVRKPRNSTINSKKFSSSSSELNFSP